MNLRTTTTALALLALAGAAASLAGPLTPPPGPVTSTYKTLDQVEARTPLSASTTPGDADSVFKITQPGSYYLTGSLQGIAGKNGIEIALGAVEGTVTIDLNGFELVGVAGSLNGVTMTPSTAPRVIIRNGGTRNWGGNGLDLGYSGGGSVEKITASHNTASGIIANESVVTDCTVRANGANGINAFAAVVRDCVARENVADGIRGYGNVTVDHCVVNHNTGNGIVMDDQGVATENNVSENTLDGIKVGFNCRVVGNSCISNGNGAGNGAGIHVTSNRNYIEGNTCLNNDRGVDVDAGNNFIVRNSANGGATAFDIVASNTAGPFVTGATFNTNTNPNANIFY